ncbi:MAG TPA: hypothetical protein VG778_11095 [Blastocatellia bacterium]|nr:hypothetical protein [Blastocatellia bacterium]
MSTIATTTEDAATNTPAASIARLLDRRAIFLLTLVAAAVIYAQFQFWKSPTRGDRANWDYMAQIIATGGVPYRDAVNIKTPLSAYISAAAIVAARPFGVEDVAAIRGIYFALAVLTVGFTFLVAVQYFSRRWVGVLAVTVLLAFDAFATLNCGTQPKTPMVLGGLMTLWAIKRDRPFEAGVYGMLSALSWQPGLLFVGVAGLAFSRYLTSWRDLKVVKLLAGAALPLLIFVGYFAIVGALNDFFVWTLHFNYSVYGPREMRSVSGFVTRFAELLNGPYRQERIYFIFAALGAVIVFAEHVWSTRGKIARWVEDAPSHAIWIAPLVYFAFCAVDIQWHADFLPFMPFVGIFAAVAFYSIIKAAVARLKRFAPQLVTSRVEYPAFALLLAAVFLGNVGDAFSFNRGFPTLQDQYVGIKEMTAFLEPGDKVFAHGRTEVLVVSKMRNASKYFFLDRGKDQYLDEIEPGGFKGWFERLKAERPRIVALGRLRMVDHAKDLRQWMEADYRRYQGSAFEFYVRRD